MVTPFRALVSLMILPRTSYWYWLSVMGLPLVPMRWVTRTWLAASRMLVSLTPPVPPRSVVVATCRLRLS